MPIFVSDDSKSSLINHIVVIFYGQGIFAA